MSIQHIESQKRWKDLSFAEQMANVGSEIERALNWKEKGNEDYSKLAFFRALELLDFTIAEAKGFPKLKELCRTREALIDYFYFDNIYGSSSKSWRNYFYCFTYQARVAEK
jgi:hypothetical protein